MKRWLLSALRGFFCIRKKAGSSVLCSQIHPARSKSESKQANISRHNIAGSEQDPQPRPQPPAAKPDKMLGRRPAGRRSCQLDATAGRRGGGREGFLELGMQVQALPSE